MTTGQPATAQRAGTRGAAFLRRGGAGLVLLVALATFVLPEARAQVTNTILVNALNDQSCMGTRSATDLNCTANDFQVIVKFDQVAATALATCLWGDELSLDIDAVLQAQNPDRYDVAVFVGENNNSPRLNNAAAQCSIGVVTSGTVVAPQTFPPPSTPSIFPFYDEDTDACADLSGVGFGASGGFNSGTATLRIQDIRPSACRRLTGTRYACRMRCRSTTWRRSAVPRRTSRPARVRSTSAARPSSASAQKRWDLFYPEKAAGPLPPGQAIILQAFSGHEGAGFFRWVHDHQPPFRY